jgi:hypothetical protein
LSGVKSIPVFVALTAGCHFDAFERLRHRARKMSFPRRSVRILVFRWK